MSSSDKYGFTLSFEEMRRISEAQIKDSNSQIYQRVLNEVAKKFILTLKLREEEDKKVGKKRTRIYVPYALDSDKKYELQRVYREFDIVPATYERAMSGLARASAICAGEAMLTHVPHNERDLLAYGTSLRTLVMRNREWMHLCQSANDPQAFVQFMKEDLALCSIYQSMLTKRKSPPMMLRRYIKSEVMPTCSAAHKCMVKANVAVAVLDRIDTNYRQLTEYMQQHGVKLMFFALPAHKNMEMGIEGQFPELDGYIAHRDGVIHVLFDGDIAYQMAFTHSNYIELIARTRIIAHGNTYIKEMVERRGGHAIYKITCTAGEHLDPVPAYKSWIDPQYRDYYVLSVPVLARFGNANTTKSWEVKRVWTRKAVVDDVLEALMMVDGDAKISEVAISRLFSKAYTSVTAGQMTRHECPLTLQQQMYAFGVLFSKAFMLKYQSGATVAAITPLARGASRLSEATIYGLLKQRITSYGAGIMENMFAGVSATLRQYNYSIEGRYDLALPEYSDAVGYIKYDQDGNGPESTAWFPEYIGPSFGFAPHLPGYMANVGGILGELRFSNVTAGDLPAANVTVLDRLAGVTGVVGRVLQGTMSYDPESLHGEMLDDTRYVPDVAAQRAPVIGTLRFSKDDMVRKPVGEIRCRQLADQQSFTPEADELVARVLGEVPGLPTNVEVVYNSYLAPPLVMDRDNGSVSRTPVQDLTSALLMLFPQSATMNTEHIEAERLYNDVSVVARSLRMKLDASKLEALKPDNAYIPVIKGHVLPHVKDSTVNTLETLAKRNADTPYFLTPAGLEERWGMVWKAMLELYFIPGTEEFLKRQEKIAPNDRNIREWAAKQQVTKLRKLLDGESFALEEMESNTRNLQLMLKGQLKPEMDMSYTTSLKKPQTIQYDKTGKSVPVLSAPIRDVVKREFYCYKPNVLVMQRKSPDDLVKFLNQFDHRPDSRGPRSYIEIDQTLFDKSQVYEVAMKYLKYLDKMGLSEEYIVLMAAMFNRSVSSVKAGVKIDLVDQNVSGAAFTLHRNNTVSMIVLALFLERIKHNIEFILMMGDDVTVAVRGEVSVAGWEADLSRMFNMTAKIAIHKHGYFCSTDIIHRPDGTTTILRDVVKALCSFMTQDIKDDDKFEEKYISFIDSFQFVDDMMTQEYAIMALPERWKAVLPSASPEAFRLLVTGLAGVKVGGKQTYRSFFSDKKHVRHH